MSQRKKSGPGKARHRDEVSCFEQIPNIGSATIGDFEILGMTEPKDLIGRDPYALYDELCRRTGERHDPCVFDVFIAAVRFMEGSPPHPWWHYTPERVREVARRIESVAYDVEPDLPVDEFIDVLKRSTLAERRPTDDRPRMERMIHGADLVVTARHNGLLIGIGRAVTDFSFCLYVSDLAVDVAFQRSGVGRRLLERIHRFAGEQTTMILLAAPKAVGYYPKIGMEQHSSCWVKRSGVTAVSQESTRRRPRATKSR